MGFYGEQVLPRFINVALGGADFDRIRSRLASPLEGRVLEVGFGSGLNVPHYPPTVTGVQAVDPAVVGRRLAAGRVATSPVPIEYVGLDGSSLPLQAGSVDHVLVTWTLCTIPDVDQALAEMRRVLRPGGRLHFVEHGRSPDHNIATWQDRLTPLQRRLFGGCHLNRQIDLLVARAGFQMEELETYYMRGPKPYGYTFEGVAARD